MCVPGRIMLDPVRSFAAPSEVLSGAMSGSYETCAIGTVTHETILLHQALDEPTVLRHCSGTVRALSFSETGDCLLTGDSTGSLFLVDVHTHERTWAVPRAHCDRIECSAFLSSSTVVVGDITGRIKVWDLRASKAVRGYRPEDEYVADFAVIDSQNYVVAHGNGVASVFSVGSTTRKQYYKQEDDDFVSIAYAPFMSYVLTASSKPRIYVTRYPELDFVAEAPGNTKAAIVAVRMLPGAPCRAAIAQEDGSICVADISPNRPIQAFRAHKALVRGAAMARTRMVTWDSDKNVRIWDLAELAGRRLEKRKKRKKGKKKQTTIPVAEKEDNFFKDY